MTKIEKIRKQYTDEQNKKVTLRADIEELEQRQKQLTSEAQQAAEAGDVDGYMNKKAQADRCSAEIYVNRLQLSKIGTMNNAEVREAWREYIKPVNKELQEAYDDYKAARKDLCDKLRKVLYIQLQAYRTREFCAECTGVSRKDSNEFYNAAATYGMDGLTAADVGKDLNLFQNTGDLSRDDGTQLYGMLLNNKAQPY